MEQPTTITAAQWELVAEDVKAGRCEVLDMFAEPVQEILLLPDGGFHVTSTNHETSEWQGKLGAENVDYFTVRWLAPAPSEQDAAVSKPEAGTEKIQGVFLESFRALHNKGVQLNPAQITYLFSLVASLQAELEQARKQVEAAEERAALWPSGMTEIEEWAWDSQGEFAPVTQEYSPNWTRGYKKILAVIEEVKEARKAAALQAQPTPQPAPASELVAAVTIEEMSSTLLPDGHEVKGLGCFIEHDGQKLLFFESSVVSDLQHDLSVAKDRIAVLEQSEQMLLKRIKKLRSKSELDDGFIDHLLANNEDSQ